MSQTVALIKPDVVAADQIGELVTEIEQHPVLSIRFMVMLHPGRAFWEDWYAEHKDKPYFESQIEFISSGPVVALVLFGNDAIENWRLFIGPTDPKVALSEAAYSIRARYGTGLPANAVHGSSSEEAVEREIKLLLDLMNSEWE